MTWLVQNQQTLFERLDETNSSSASKFLHLSHLWFARLVLFSFKQVKAGFSQHHYILQHYFCSQRNWTDARGCVTSVPCSCFLILLTADSRMWWQRKLKDESVALTMFLLWCWEHQRTSTAAFSQQNCAVMRIMFVNKNINVVCTYIVISKHTNIHKFLFFTL